MLGVPNDHGVSYYEKVGGHATFTRLISAFFAGVRAEPELRAIYHHDLQGAEERLLLFFEQYWGGPMTYSRTRGAPRLKMRHMAYRITPHMRDLWVARMRDAIASVGLHDDDAAEMHEYVERAADFLVNAD